VAAQHCPEPQLCCLVPQCWGRACLADAPQSQQRGRLQGTGAAVWQVLRLCLFGMSRHMLALRSVLIQTPDVHMIGSCGFLMLMVHW
jgi:hypothetical protein